MTKAFPHTYEKMIDGDIVTCTNTGMDLRDWFAGLAMEGIVFEGVSPEKTAKAAYKMADAMMEARNAKTQK